MKNLLKTLNAVRKEIGSIEKNGKNNFHNYKFQSWEDVLVKVRAACDNHGLMIFPSVTDYQTSQVVNDKEKKSYRTIVSFKFTVADIPSGESMEMVWLGEADDSGDKGVNKAGTAAYKYFCLKLFQITTKDDEDPDGQSPNVAVAPKPTQTGGYSLPLKDTKNAEKKAKELGVDWNTFVATCEVRNITKPSDLTALMESMAVAK